MATCETCANNFAAVRTTLIQLAAALYDIGAAAAPFAEENQFFDRVLAAQMAIEDIEPQGEHRHPGHD